MEGKTIKSVQELENNYVQIVFEDGTFVIAKVVANSGGLVLTAAQPEEEEAPKKKKKKSKKKAEPEPEPEPEEEPEEEEEEDGEGYTKEDIKGAEFDELVELVDDEELDIDTEDFSDTKKGTKKLQSAIIKALGL